MGYRMLFLSFLREKTYTGRMKAEKPIWGTLPLYRWFYWVDEKCDHPTSPTHPLSEVGRVGIVVITFRNIVKNHEELQLIINWKPRSVVFERKLNTIHKILLLRSYQSFGKRVTNAKIRHFSVRVACNYRGLCLWRIIYRYANLLHEGK